MNKTNSESEYAATASVAYVPYFAFAAFKAFAVSEVSAALMTSVCGTTEAVALCSYEPCN